MSDRAVRKSDPHVPGRARATGEEPPDLRLDVTSDPAHLATVRHACEAFCVECGLSESSAGDVGLVVNEAMANITRHAYSGATDRPVVVTGRCDRRANAVVITIRDWGTGFNPESVRPKQDPAQPGGLGMVCIRCLVDEAIFSPQPDGMLLTLVKKNGSRPCLSMPPTVP
jgi:serine/threonine-protein kinase RsbW